MATISQRIPNLLGGVSQQPDSLKLPGQVRRAINCLPDPTYGMMKRPGLKLISSLTGASATGRWFSIVRDQSERYVCQFLTDGTLKVWDGYTGAVKTVNAITNDAKAYIANVAAEDFEVLQINDYNFVLNRSKTVAKDLVNKSPVQPPVALLIVAQIGYDATYTVKINGLSVSHTTPTTGALTVGAVVADLKTKIEALSGGGVYSATIAANTLIVKRVNDADFNIDATGGISSTALLAYKNTVPNAARLPAVSQNGLVLKVSNLEDANSDDYYVKFVTSDGGAVGSGVWEECVAPNTEIYIDPNTMPHVIIRETNGTFTYRALSEAEKDGEDLYWVERRVGDDETNPFPTLVGRKVTGLSFYRNRLVLLSEANVICSQPGSYFNLFRESALIQTDADSIDLATGSLRPVDLRYAIGDQQGLVCFSENGQFILTSNEDVFSPSTAKLQPFTSFNSNSKVNPVETGQSIVFVDNNQGFSSVTEMLVTSSENRPSVADISRTAPTFVPGDLEPIVASISASLICFLGRSNRKSLKLFKFFNNGSERILASWIEWALPGDCLHVSVDHDLLLFVTNQENGICLSTCSTVVDIEGTAVNDSGLAYEYRLDLFKSAPTMSYDAGNDETKIYFPAGAYDSTLTPVVCVSETQQVTGTFYSDLPPANDGNWYVAVPGDVTGYYNVTIGYSYEMTLEMPRFYLVNQAADGRAQADVINIPRVHRLNVQSTDSGYYYATVESLGRPTRTHEFPNTFANLTPLDRAALPQATSNNIPVYAKGTEAKVTIYSDTPFPLSFVAATWYGVYANRGIRSV